MLVNAYHDYCIIGAGPSGLQMGYFFQRAARDYVIYEKSNVSGKVTREIINDLDIQWKLKVTLTVLSESSPSKYTRT